MKADILVVEDDPPTCALVKECLEKDGHRVSVAYGADRALALIRERLPDLLVLDIALPGFSGLQLCRHLRQDARTAPLPILVLTSLVREKERVEGLDAGADDYVTKPFSAAELRARVRALLRRSRGEGAAAGPLRAGEIALDPEARSVTVGGKRVALRPKEFELLAVLLRKKGKALAWHFLGEAVWGPESLATSHTVAVCVWGLRKKLGRSARLIVPVTGVGYKLEED